IYESIFIIAITRMLRLKRPLSEVVDLFFAGQGPWLLFFIGIAGVCLFATNVWTALLTLLSTGVLPIYFLLTIAWSVWLTFAFFRGGLGFSPARAAIGCLLFYA